MHRKVRFSIALAIVLCSYFTCVYGLFFTNAFLIPVISFLILFIWIYFLAIDIHKYPLTYLLFLMIGLSIGELLLIETKTWHTYVEILLFNGAIVIFFRLLWYNLRNRIRFSAFSYFTEWGYTVAAILTLFFSVLVLGKYSQLPFNCDDLESFPKNMLQAPVDTTTSLRNSTKQRRNSLFISPDTSLKPEVPAEPSDLSEPSEPSEIESFFIRTKNYFQSEAMQLQWEISKNSCEFVMDTLKKVQISQGFQIAVIVLLYLLLIGIFKILLRIVSIIGFFLFVALKPFKIYTYKKETIQWEKIT